MKTIEVEASGKPGWPEGAYTLCFVKSRDHGNFIVKGYMKEVREYLKQNYTHWFANFVLYPQWRFSKGRNIWYFWKDSISLYHLSHKYHRLFYSFRFSNSKKSGYYVKASYNHIGPKVPTMYFKRLPNKWIPEFDKL